MKKSKSFNNKVLWLTLVFVNAALLSTFESIQAGSASKPLAVSATVVKSCRISTAPLLFGNYDPPEANAASNPQATAMVTVVCSKGAAATVGLSTGNNGPSTLTTRSLSNSISRLDYEIYQDPGHTQVWGHSIGNHLDAGTAGGYTDTIIATINF